MGLKEKLKKIGLIGSITVLLGIEALFVTAYATSRPKVEEQKVVPKTDYVTQLPIPYDKIKEIATADMNGDGKQDIIILGGSNSQNLTNVYVLLNEGNGNYILQERRKPKIEANDITDVTDPEEIKALDKLIDGMEGGK